jgi:hypothetical protein
MADGVRAPTDRRAIPNHPTQQIEDAAPRQLTVEEEEVGVVVVAAAESKHPRARAPWWSPTSPSSSPTLMSPTTASRAAAATAPELASTTVEEEAEVEVKSGRRSHGGGGHRERSSCRGRGRCHGPELQLLPHHGERRRAMGTPLGSRSSSIPRGRRFPAPAAPPWKGELRGWRPSEDDEPE